MRKKQGEGEASKIDSVGRFKCKNQLAAEIDGRAAMIHDGWERMGHQQAEIWN
jgi:hypothetical protein